MLYIASLILLSCASFLFVKFLFSLIKFTEEDEAIRLRSEYALLLGKTEGLKKNNMALENNVNDTISLYDINKDISRQLDESRIFSIFKERVSNYIKLEECVYFQGKEAPIGYKDSFVLPLVINRETKGYLVASGIAEKDRQRFHILAQQLMIMLRRSLLFKRVQELAIIDGLTKVFCRRHFLERLDEEIKRSIKFKYKFSFLMVDIDRFKSFNDRYGHLVGDAILKEVSAAIKDSIRQIDFVGRYGGEELSVVLPETDKEQALFAAERMRHSIESRKIKVYDEEVKVTVSIGLATFPDDSDNGLSLIDKADQALYSAKESGRNRSCVYHNQGFSE